MRVDRSIITFLTLKKFTTLCVFFQNMTIHATFSCTGKVIWITGQGSGEADVGQGVGGHCEPGQEVPLHLLRQGAEPVPHKQVELPGGGAQAAAGRRIVARQLEEGRRRDRQATYMAHIRDVSTTRK